MRRLWRSKGRGAPSLDMQTNPPASHQPATSSALTAPVSASAALLEHRATIRELAEIGSKLVIGLLGACYVAGLLIVNLNLRKYGIFHLGFAQIEYVMVGALWMIVTFFGYLAWGEIADAIANAYRSIKGGKKKWWAVGKALLTVVLVIGAVRFFLILFCNGFLSHPQHWWIVSGVMAASGSLHIAAWPLSGFWTRFKQVAHIGEVRQILREAMSTNTMQQMTVVLSGFAAYANWVYPHLLPQYGGGQKQRVAFIAKAEQTTVLNSLGFKLSPDDRKSTQMEMIFETSDYYVVVPPGGSNSMQEVKAIRIRKDLMDATYYLESPTPGAQPSPQPTTPQNSQPSPTVTASAPDQGEKK